MKRINLIYCLSSYTRMKFTLSKSPILVGLLYLVRKKRSEDEVLWNGIIRDEARESITWSGEQKSSGFMRGLKLNERGREQWALQLVELVCDTDTKVKGTRGESWEKAILGISWVCSIEKEVEGRGKWQECQQSRVSVKTSTERAAVGKGRSMTVVYPRMYESV